MSITRRQFLEKLATIGLVTAALPKVAASALLEDPKTISMMQQPSGSLTLKALEEAYQQCVYGYDEPDLMVMSNDIYAEFRILMYDLGNRMNRPEYFVPATLNGEEVICPIFNAAYVLHDKEIPPRTWLNINSKACEEKPRIKHYRDVLVGLQIEVTYIGRDETRSGMFQIDSFSRVHRKDIPAEVYHR